MNHFIVACTLLLMSSLAGFTQAAEKSPSNVLMITLDDMNWDSLGCTGSKVPGISPNIDKLASQGMRFLHSHVTIAVCQPTRSVWVTGRYPHNNGALGFQPINTQIPTLGESLSKAGYYNGIMAKVGHLAPQRKFAWNFVVQPNQLKNGRDPKLYYKHATDFFAKARAEGKPFFLMANSQDPHRPFAGSPQEHQRRGGKNKKGKKAKNIKSKKDGNFPGVSRTYQPDEVTVPDFLPDIPEVRQEMAEYYTSVHRADEIVGAVLKALEETGQSDNTLVMFMSDHGMPLPFAKTNCYLSSTRTPWIVRWPGKVKADTVDTTHMISGIDFTPTILDALGLPPIEGVDGRSFLPILNGEKQKGRNSVYTVFHRTSGRKDFEMRSVVTKQFGYIYNGWSNGKTIFRNESQNGRTFRAMQAAGKTDPKIAARVKLFQYRVKEEFFDYEADPAALNNLIDDPKHQETIQMFRQRMQSRMKRVNDPLLGQFRKDIQ